MDPGEFIERIVANDVPAVRSALAEDRSLVAARDDYLGSTPLHFSAHRGFIEIVEALLEAGADVHALERASDTTPLHWAAEGGHPAIARLFVERGADLEALDGWYRLAPLGWTSVVTWAPPFHEDKAATATFLLEAGARLDPFTAIAARNAEALRALVAADALVLSRRLGFLGEEMTPLHFAIARRASESVRTLLELGADPSARSSWGLTPLALALKNQDRAVVALLKERGVRNDSSAAMIADDLDSMEALLEAEDESGDGSAKAARTALLFTAAHEGMEEAAEILLEHGADPNTRTRHLVGEVPVQVSALHLAAMRGHLAAAEVLLEQGAVPNGGAEGGAPTPLHVAAGAGQLEMVQLLLESGADPEAKESGFGATPLGWAEHSGHAEVAALLRGDADEELE